MLRCIRNSLIIFVVLAVVESSSAQGLSATADTKATARERARMLIDEIRAESFPELRDADLRVKTFSSDSDYFRSRLGLPQFFFGKMRCIIEVNPAAFDLDAPPSALRAIIAHEIAHSLYYKKRNRVRLLGLVRLLSKDFTAGFERWADLQAISRGYGEGLREYRKWLYRNVPANRIDEKKRNYFSPEEIDAILSAVKERPELMGIWLKRAPRNLREIEAAKTSRQSRQPKTVSRHSPLSKRTSTSSLAKPCVSDDWNLRAANDEHCEAADKHRDGQREQKPAIARSIGVDHRDAQFGQVAHDGSAYDSRSDDCADGDSRWDKQENDGDEFDHS
jgi:hypothetical protein